MVRMLAFRTSGPEFRAWLLATNRNTIALWPTLMGIFNLLTLFEKHSAFYHSLSCTCLTVSLVLRHYTMKGRPEAVSSVLCCLF
ncbi:hypothetical protein DUNSADRAFT_10856 [Dunaliella salina]|uniref:Uncharacterized protein n=1 Tax=Dunaliella salina TaxID=3046 RepID=A0ABQ7HA00_DUNSA|nr:hypothetical protein DUNSADRAFT_10856 [Dunaliella salina]|eukprot:KAF5843681.1 hypothetical protein DUNSADRAFT_10856 [Dunaliella salina]